MAGKRKASDDEEAEGASSGPDSDVKVKKPIVKKPKAEKEKKPKKEVASKKKKKSSDDEADEEEDVDDGAGPSSGKVVVHKGENPGEKYISLGNHRRVTVRSFKGKPLVDFREFYEDKKDGTEKPGKKGLSLTLEQWAALRDSASEIDNIIAKLK